MAPCFTHLLLTYFSLTSLPLSLPSYLCPSLPPSHPPSLPLSLPHCSPQITAASEKLTKLHGSPSISSQEEKASPVTSASSAMMPTASSDVLEAQRKRFEELKVSVLCSNLKCLHVCICTCTMFVHVYTHKFFESYRHCCVVYI